MFKRKVLKDKRDDGKGSGGKPPKTKFPQRGMVEPKAEDPRLRSILSFLKGEPVDQDKVLDAREVLFGPSPDKPPKME